MNPAAIEWLRINKQTLIESDSNLSECTLWIVDILIRYGIYSPADDDYQHVQAQRLHSDQLQALLGSLFCKGPHAVAVFQEALQKFCPDVLSVCCDPPKSGAVSKVGDYCSTVLTFCKLRMSKATKLRLHNLVKDPSLLVRSIIRVL